MIWFERGRSFRALLAGWAAGEWHLVGSTIRDRLLPGAIGRTHKGKRRCRTNIFACEKHGMVQRRGANGVPISASANGALCARITARTAMRGIISRTITRAAGPIA